MIDWSKAKVVDLKAELKKRGLPQTGLKPALVARLTAAEIEDGSESEATVQGDGLKLNSSAVTSPDTVSPTQPSSAEVLPDAPLRTTTEPDLEVSNKAASPDIDRVGASMVDRPTEHLTTQTNVVDFSQTPSQATNERSALPSVEPQEAMEDRQKRKRRSETPPLSESDAARKRFRQDDEPEDVKDEDATVKDDSVLVEKHNTLDQAQHNTANEEVDLIAGDKLIIDVSKEEVIEDARAENRDGMDLDLEGKAPSKVADASPEPLDESPSRTRDTRFKGLFPSPETAAVMEKSGSGDSAHDAAEPKPDRHISPAIHPATSAIYIRDFMRPLNPSQLKAHLATLATPPGRDVDPGIVVNFYLDPIRTHAFISFNTVSAASRVRSVLHDCIWPEERTRKPLWVDFIPSEKVEEWVEKEQYPKVEGRTMAKKWEVVYDVDEDRHVVATLQESGNIPKPQQGRRPSLLLPPAAPAPTSIPSRGIEGAPSGPRAEQVREQRAATNLATLDQLFRSTIAKPTLYWQPVSKSLANKRLDKIDNATSKDAVGDRLGGEINRYTFEDGDVLVDRGPEIFSGIRPPSGFRGGRGGGPRGGGGSQSRGGYGGDRAYDRYRADRLDSRNDRRY